MKCADCVHADHFVDEFLCRYDAPQINPVNGSGNWPSVKAEDWCGKFQAELPTFRPMEAEEQLSSEASVRKDRDEWPTYS